MILSKEEFIAAIKNKIGESTEDADIKLLEDLVDTYDNLEAAANVELIDDLKNQLEEAKRKYIERFSGAEEKVEEVKEEEKENPEDEKDEPEKFDDLFEKEEE